MPISPYLDGERFDSETKRVLGLAFELVRVAQSRGHVRTGAGGLSRAAGRPGDRMTA
jgi:hypothetical protein